MNRSPDWAIGSVYAFNFSVRQYQHGLFYVYVAWGRNRQRPLYVGKTNLPMGRIGNHFRDSVWARRVQAFNCYGFQTEREALQAELRAIKELNPVYNVIRSEPAFDEDEQAAIIRRVQNRGAA